MTTVTPPATRAPARLTPPVLVLLALLSAFTPLSIDMYLPALPTIVGDLRSTAGDFQLTLSGFMLALGFGQILYGPAAGRPPLRPPSGDPVGHRDLHRHARRLRLRRRSGPAGAAALPARAGGVRQRR